MTASTPPYAAAQVGNDCGTTIPEVDLTAGAVASPDERLFVPIEGDLDLFTTPDLTQWLCPLAGQGLHLTLDLSGLEFLGVAGLLLFVHLHDAAGVSGGSLQLDSVPESTRRLLRVVGLDALLDRAPAPSAISLDEATDPTESVPLRPSNTFRKPPLPTSLASQ